MIFNMKRSPFFIILLGLIACTKAGKLNLEFGSALVKAEQFYYALQKDSAFYYYNKAYESCSMNDADQKLYCAAMMANIQNQYGDYSGAEQTLTDVIPLENIVNNKDYLIQVYNEYGKSYRMQKNYQSALANYNKCLLINKDSLQEIILKNNMAVIFIDLEQPKKAIDLLSPLLNQKAIFKDTVCLARVIDNMGLAYLKSGDRQTSNKYLNQSLFLRGQINDDFQKASSYLNLAKYHENNDHESSLIFAEKAWSSSFGSKNPDDQLKALSYLINNPLNQNANLHFKKYIRINDSLTTIRQQAKNQFAKIKFDYSQAKSESIFHKKQKTLYLLLFVLAIISAILGYFFIKKKNKLKLHQSVYDTETRLSKKLHDELANDVFQTITYAEYKDLEQPENKVKLIDYLEKIYNRTRNISRENSDIDLSENYFDGLKAMIMTFDNQQTNIILNTNKIDELTIKKPSKIVLYRVIQELLINMKKHSQANVVLITFKEDKKHYEINYSDNGLGCENNNFEKNGLKNAENRILSIHGSITFDTSTNNGFKVKMTIPK